MRRRGALALWNTRPGEGGPLSSSLLRRDEYSCGLPLTYVQCKEFTLFIAVIQIENSIMAITGHSSCHRIMHARIILNVGRSRIAAT